MSITYVKVVASGAVGSNTITVPFPYLRREHIHAYVNEEERDFESLTWLSSGVLKLPDSDVSLTGKTILVKRITPIDGPAAVFGPGVLDPTDLNTVTLQGLYADQERADAIEDLQPGSGELPYLTNVANLADLQDIGQARTNLALGTAATRNVGTGPGTVAAGDDPRFDGLGEVDLTSVLSKPNNLNDVPNKPQARANLGLGGAAELNVGTGPGTVAAGDDPRFAGPNFLLKTANLSDLGNAAVARANLMLGTAATRNVGTGPGTVAAGDDPRFLNPIIGGQFNIKNYGAVGDGVTDDTAAIQACINASYAGGYAGQFWAPPGVYGITGDGLKVGSYGSIWGGTITGAGHQTVFKKLSGSGPILTIEGCGGRVSGIMLDGNNVAQTCAYIKMGRFNVPLVWDCVAFYRATTYGIYHKDGDQVHYRNCWITSCGSYGCYYRNSGMNSNWIGCWIWNCLTGIYCNGHDPDSLYGQFQVEGLSLIGCVFIGTAMDYGIVFYKGLEVQVVGCTFDQMRTTAVSLPYAATYVKFTNNWFGASDAHNNGGNLVQINGNSGRLKFTDNSFNGGSGLGLQLNAANPGDIQDVSIIGNTFGRSGAGALQIYNGAGVRIISNYSFGGEDRGGSPSSLTFAGVNSFIAFNRWHTPAGITNNGGVLSSGTTWNIG